MFFNGNEIPDSRIWYLISKDSKGKFRYSIISYKLIDPDGDRYFLIERYSGQYKGKRTQQPNKTVERGKASRNLWQQVDLEAKHLVKEKLDKGYRELTKDPDLYTESELNEILGETITGQNGVPKPMLAKQSEKVTNSKIYDKVWYASRKIDGLRTLIYLGDDHLLHTASRGGTNYDTGMSEILQHPDLIKAFEENPGLIMDGECFKFGMTLQQINSIARSQKTAVDYGILQFYWYDIVDTNKSFKERLSIMNNIKESLSLSFDPEREFEYGELRIQFVPQIQVSGWDNMMDLHNTYVSKGWEGLVIRDPDKVYKPNGRTNDMIKIKKYKDDNFIVIDYELGLRGSEDMVFICQMDDGRTFKVKPLGDRLQKEDYVSNFETLYKNHLGECKYFYYSDDGIPLQPVFKAFRFDLE